MAHNLDDFIENFGGGTRAHRYRISAGDIPGTSETQLDRFHVRALEIPPSQVNPIRIPYRGRILKWAGDRLYFPWTIRILDDKGGNNTDKIDTLWRAFHNWSNSINDHKTNVHNTPGSQTGFDTWTADWSFEQVDGDSEGTDNDGTVLKQINLFGCWPTTIGPISLDANSVDQLSEFTVTMEYQYYTVTIPNINDSAAGGGGGGGGDGSGDG
jgi:hypothetical protein